MIKYSSLLIVVNIAISGQLAFATLAIYTNPSDFAASTGGAALSTEQLDSLATGPNAGPQSFGNLAVNTDSGFVFGFNGSINWLDGSTNDGDITFTFESAVNAFAIDIDDLGRGNGGSIPTVLSVSIDGGAPTDVFDFTSQPNQSSQPLFLGLRDTMNTFTTVRFSNTATTDGVLLDGAQFGVVPVPETNSFALIGLAFAACAATRFRFGIIRKLFRMLKV